MGWNPMDRGPDGRQFWVLVLFVVCAHVAPVAAHMLSPEMSPAPALILASTSSSRRRLLEDAGLVFSTEAPRLDEEMLRATLAADGVSSRDQADALADGKARKIADKHPDAIVIGADQILDFEGAVFTKPETPDDLRQQLATLSGQTHRLYAAAVVYENARPVWRHIGEARLTMHALSPSVIEAYVARNWDTVRHSVGGYHIEAEGVRLFSRLEGSYHAVLGLPLIELLSYLSSREVITI